MDQFRDIVNGPLIPTQPTAGNEFNTTVASTWNEIDDLGMGITKTELDELLVDEKNLLISK